MVRPTLVPEESILSDPQQMIAIKEWNERYLHWDEIRYRVDADKALGTWAVMKLLRSNNLMSIDICGLKLKYSLLSSFLKMLHHIDMDSAGYVTMGNPGEKNVKKYVISSLMEEAIASSQLEGAATTRKDAKKVLRTQRKPSNISELMIFNNPQMNQLLALDGTTLDPPLGMTSFHSVSSPFLTKMHVPVRDRSSSRYSPTFL